MKRFIIVLLGLLLTNTAFSVNLLQVYHDALHYDPIYRKAVADYHASIEALPQAVAALLPSISATANTTRNKLKLSTRPVATFNSNGYTISVTQPVFNFANWMSVRSSCATVKAALTQLGAAQEDLIVRVAAAYLDVLLAEDTLRFSRAEKRAVGQQLEQTQQRFKVGLDAVTSVYNSRASFDSISAQVIAAQNDTRNKREILRQITGHYYSHLAPLKHRIPLQRPKPNNIKIWTKTAIHHNLTLLSARYAAVSSHAAVGAQFAGHLPSIDIIGAYSDTRSGSPITSAPRTRSGTVALQVSLPIFSGFGVVSRTRQADYEYQSAMATMVSAYRSTISATRQTFNNIVSGISKIKADRQAIVSQRAALESTVAAFKVGTRTMVDVLNDQQNLTQSQQVYAADQYAYINSTLQLKQAAGQLSPKDLNAINAWLKSAPYGSAKAVHTHWNTEPHQTPRVVVVDHAAHHHSTKSLGHQSTHQHLQKKHSPPPFSPEQKTLLKAPDSDYTIQLTTVKTLQKSQDFIKENKLQDQVKIFKADHQGAILYDIVYGRYPSKSLALAALKNLPNSLYHTTPWVVSMKEVKRDILRLRRTTP